MLFKVKFVVKKWHAIKDALFLSSVCLTGITVRDEGGVR